MIDLRNTPEDKQIITQIKEFMPYWKRINWEVKKTNFRTKGRCGIYDIDYHKYYNLEE